MKEVYNIGHGGNAKNWAKRLRRYGADPVKVKRPERYLNSSRSTR